MLAESVRSAATGGRLPDGQLTLAGHDPGYVYSVTVISLVNSMIESCPAY